MPWVGGFEGRNGPLEIRPLHVLLSPDLGSPWRIIFFSFPLENPGFGSSSFFFSFFFCVCLCVSLSSPTQIATAVKFLQNSRVRQSPLATRRAFLKKKGRGKRVDQQVSFSLGARGIPSTSLSCQGQPLSQCWGMPLRLPSIRLGWGRGTEAAIRLGWRHGTEAAIRLY